MYRLDPFFLFRAASGTLVIVATKKHSVLA